MDDGNAALIEYDASAGRFTAHGGAPDIAAFCVTYGTFAANGAPFAVVEACTSMTLVKTFDVVDEVLVSLSRTTLARARPSWPAS